MNRGLVPLPVLTDYTDREMFRDRVGQCHEMSGVQRNGPLCLNRDTAIAVEVEASWLALASDRLR